MQIRTAATEAEEIAIERKQSPKTATEVGHDLAVSETLDTDAPEETVDTDAPEVETTKNETSPHKPVPDITRMITRTTAAANTTEGKKNVEVSTAVDMALANGSGDAGFSIGMGELSSVGVIRRERISRRKAKKAVKCVVVLANDILASGSGSDISLWNIATEELIDELKGHARSVRSLAVLADNVLASGSDDGAIWLWNVSTRRTIRELKGHSGGVYSLEVLPSNVLASGGGDKYIRLWNVSKRTTIRELKGHAERVYSLAALRNYKDFQALASGCNKGQLRLWDTTTGDMVSALGHDPILALDIGMDYSRLDDRIWAVDDVVPHGVVTASDSLENNAQQSPHPSHKAQDQPRRSKSGGFLRAMIKKVSKVFSRWSRKHEKEKSQNTKHKT